MILNFLNSAAFSLRHGIRTLDTLYPNSRQTRRSLNRCVSTTRPRGVSVAKPISKLLSGVLRPLCGIIAGRDGSRLLEDLARRIICHSCGRLPTCGSIKVQVRDYLHCTDSALPALFARRSLDRVDEVVCRQAGRNARPIPTSPSRCKPAAMALATRLAQAGGGTDPHGT